MVKVGRVVLSSFFSTAPPSEREGRCSVIYPDINTFFSPAQPILNQAGLPQGPSDQKVVIVTVDNCDTSVALRFGHMIGNYTCSARGSQSGSKK